MALLTFHTSLCGGHFATERDGGFTATGESRKTFSPEDIFRPIFVQVNFALRPASGKLRRKMIHKETLRVKFYVLDIGLKCLLWQLYLFK